MGTDMHFNHASKKAGMQARVGRPLRLAISRRHKKCACKASELQQHRVDRSPPGIDCEGSVYEVLRDAMIGDVEESCKAAEQLGQLRQLGCADAMRAQSRVKSL